MSPKQSLIHLEVIVSVIAIGATTVSDRRLVAVTGLKKGFNGWGFHCKTAGSCSLVSLPTPHPLLNYQGDGEEWEGWEI